MAKLTNAAHHVLEGGQWVRYSTTSEAITAYKWQFWHNRPSAILANGVYLVRVCHGAQVTGHKINGKITRSFEIDVSNNTVHNGPERTDRNFCGNLKSGM